MVLLAKTIYSDTPDYGSPMVLLNSSRFTTATLIREHLFDQFIPAAYRVHPASSRSRTRWSAQRAEQWLIFLAHDMERRQQGGSDIAWWRLSGAVPRPLIAGSFGAISGLSGALLFPFPANLGVGLVLAVTVVLISRKVVRNEKSGFVRCLAGGILRGSGEHRRRNHRLRRRATLYQSQRLPLGRPRFCCCGFTFWWICHRIHCNLCNKAILDVSR